MYDAVAGIFIVVGISVGAASMVLAVDYCAKAPDREKLREEIAECQEMGKRAGASEIHYARISQRCFMKNWDGWYYFHPAEGLQKTSVLPKEPQ